MTTTQLVTFTLLHVLLVYLVAAYVAWWASLPLIPPGMWIVWKGLS